MPSLPPSITEVFPPFNTAPPPVTDQGHVPAIPPANPQGKEPVAEAPVSLPVAPGRGPVSKISSILSLSSPHQVL